MKTAYIKDLAKIGSIGIKSRISPIDVISPFLSRASITFNVSIEVSIPCLSGGEMYEKVNRFYIPKDFNRKITVSRLEFYIYGTLPKGRDLKLSNEYRRKQKPGAVLPALPALCFAED